MSVWVICAALALGQTPATAPDGGEPSDAEVIANLELLEALPEVEAYEVYEALREEGQEGSKPPAQGP